ncbi:MAG: hypothetical protein ACRYFA_12555 [Janthinobacterium lividum]
MKTLYCILLSIFISHFAQAQQVTKVECCVEIGGKASIIINDNSSSGSAQATSPVNTTTVNGGFDFKLDVSANTSAGVYNTNDVLIRTLWSGVRYEAGCYTGKWDGYLDDGTTLAALGSYTVKVVSNNILPTWEGSVGNTSLNLTGPNIHKGYFPMQCIAITSSNLYYGSGYSEAQSSNHYAALNNIQVRSDALYGATTQSTYFCCSDNTNVYWGGIDANSGTYQTDPTFPTFINQNLFIHKTSLNNTLASFSQGTSYQVNHGTNYNSVVGITSSGTNNTNITGMDVQKNGNFLFVAFGKLNRLLVIDKNTGATIQTLTINNIGSVACDYSGNLWVGTATANEVSSTFAITQGSNGIIKKYTINSSTGTITPTTTVIGNYTNYKKGFSYDSEQFAISPVTGNLRLTDVVTNQFKLYNASNGNLISTKGVVGGYANGPAVSYDKFMMTGFRDGAKPFIAYQADGTWWGNDSMNFRTIHFTEAGDFIEQIAYLGRVRNVTVDKNDATRIFANFNEFKRDYTKTLAGTNGSWTLANNWYYGLTENQVNDYTGFQEVATLPNGRTYANGVGNIKELTTFGLKETGVEGAFFDSNLNLYKQTQFTGATETNTIFQNLRTGFDASGNPIYSGFTTYCTTPTYSFQKPIPYNNALHVDKVNPDKWIFWKGNNDDGLHLGSIKRGQNNFEWMATPSTFKGDPTYQGAYPLDGTLDIGNYKNNNNSPAHYLDNFIIWNDHGEFYRGGQEQPNIWNMFTDSGLFLINFGEEVRSPGGVTAGVWEAGNTFSSGMAKLGNMYKGFYSDESYHSGIGEYTLDNIGSVYTISIPLTVSAVISKNVDAADIMAELPFRSSDFTGGNGWTKTSLNGFNIKTSVLAYKKNSVDLYITANNSQDNFLTRDLGNNNTNGWTVSGKAYFQYGSYNDNDAMAIKVFDVNGKELVRFRVTTDNTYTKRVIFNNNVVLSTPSSSALAVMLNSLQPFSINNSDGQIQVIFANYSAIVTTPFEQGADFTKPAKIQVKLNAGDGRVIDISELKFKLINEKN